MTTPALDQLEALRRLPENWDGYQAAAPRADIVDLAQEFVRLFQILKPATIAGFTLHISPTRTGGVLVEWEDSVSQHEVEFGTDGAISFLHTNTLSGHIENRKFAPGARGVIPPGLLQELRALAAA